MPQAAPGFESEMANIRSKHLEIDDDDFFAIVELAHDYTILTGTACNRSHPPCIARDAESVGVRAGKQGLRVGGNRILRLEWLADSTPI
jgi:hypothetical protein